MRIKFLILGSLLLAFVSCKKAQVPVDYVLFSGKIINSEEKQVLVNGKNFDFTINVRSDGTFGDTLRIKDKGYYTYVIGREKSIVYIKQNDQLNLSIDANDFKESVKYTGTAAEVNNYIAAKTIMNEQLSPKGEQERNELYGKDEEDFKNTIKEYKQQKLDLLNSYKNLDADFIAYETKDINYGYLFLLNRYEDAHQYYAKDKNYKVPEGYLQELTDLGLDTDLGIDIAEDFNTSKAYQNLVLDLFNKSAYQKAENDKISYEKAFLEGLTSIKSINIKESLIKTIARRVSIGFHNTTELYISIMKISTDEKFKAELTNIYKKVKTLVKGNQSPLFNYENHDGGETSLSDLKGKYVLINIWATWSVPSENEMLSLAKIEKEYRKKNIAFVSISVDKKTQYETWKKKVIEKKLVGIQLFANDSWNSQFILDYQIQGIPRFILIDPEGRIVNANAPRPSDPDLVLLLKELNI